MKQTKLDHFITICLALTMLAGLICAATGRLEGQEPPTTTEDTAQVLVQSPPEKPVVDVTKEALAKWAAAGGDVSTPTKRDWQGIPCPRVDGVAQCPEPPPNTYKVAGSTYAGTPKRVAPAPAPAPIVFPSIPDYPLPSETLRRAPVYSPLDIMIKMQMLQNMQQRQRVPYRINPGITCYTDTIGPGITTRCN